MVVTKLSTTVAVVVTMILVIVDWIVVVSMVVGWTEMNLLQNGVALRADMTL
jgi:hypothetical protein